MASLHELIPNLKNTREEHVKNNRKIEVSVCDLFLTIFERCFRKHKVGKHRDYIYNEFYSADRKRLQFKEDEMVEDAFQQALVQEALRQFWEACDLPKTDLVKAKHLPLFIPRNEISSYRTGRYMG